MPKILRPAVNGLFHSVELDYPECRLHLPYSLSWYKAWRNGLVKAQANNSTVRTIRIVNDLEDCIKRLEGSNDEP